MPGGRRQGVKVEWRKGGSITVVEIRTRDCGPLGWTSGVDYQNVKEVAASIKPGVYKIRIGWFSRYFVSLWPNGVPRIQCYEYSGPLPPR